jgi:hypothetical protein
MTAFPGSDDARTSANAPKFPKGCASGCKKQNFFGLNRILPPLTLLQGDFAPPDSSGVHSRHLSFRPFRPSGGTRKNRLLNPENTANPHLLGGEAKTTMKNQVSDVQWGVIEDLQNLCRKSKPGSYWAEVYERAIDYALSDRRTSFTSSKQLLSAVVRDAKKWMTRRREDPTDFSNDPIACNYSSSTPDPAIIVQIGDEIGRFTGSLGNISDEAKECLQGMLVGESIKSTADSVRISERRVRHIRSRLREKGLKFWEDAA